MFLWILNYKQRVTYALITGKVGRSLSKIFLFGMKEEQLEELLNTVVNASAAYKNPTKDNNTNTND